MMPISGQDEGLEPFRDQVFAGESTPVQRLRLQVARIAPHFRVVLVTGERSVGKLTIARELHRLSPVAEGPFACRQIVDFCSLNVHEMGRGTLFLRGLERLEPGLQERFLERLKSVHRETRVVVASECDLRGMVAAGRVRQDLKARLEMLEIHVSPLRERMPDLEMLIGAMLVRVGSAAMVGSEVLRKMQGYGWPGNLLELWQMAGRVAGCEGVLGTMDLELPESEGMGARGPTVRLEEVMQRHVIDVLQRCAGNKLKTAELLGISRSTLYRMLEVAAV